MQDHTKIIKRMRRIMANYGKIVWEEGVSEQEKKGEVKGSSPRSCRYYLN